MQEGTQDSGITDSELQLLRRRVKHLEAEVQRLRRDQELPDHPENLDSVGGLSLLMGIEEGLAVFSSDWRFLLCNRNAELLLRRSPGSLTGKRLWDEFPELVGTPTELALQRSMSERVVETTEIYFEPLAGWFQGRIYPNSTGGILVFFNNVTEQKTAEAALRRSEERWRTLADTIPQFVWVAMNYGDVQFINAHWYEYTGLPKGRTDLGTMYKAVHPDDLSIIADMWQDAVAEKREKTFEYRVRRASDGMYRWHRGFHRPERDKEGNIIRWVGCGVDIHDIKMAREELSVLAERQKLAIDAGGVGLWDWEIEEDKVNWTEKVYELHGLTPGSFIGTLAAFTKLIHVEDAARVRTSIQEAVSSGRFETQEFRVIRPTSEIRWIAMRAQVVSDASGKAVRLLGASIDITERKSAEAKLARQVAEFETLFRELPVGVGVAYDRRCDVVRINPAFAAMLGIPAESNASKNFPIGDGLRFRVMQGDREVAPEDLPMQVAARTGREVRNFIYELVRSDGSRVQEYGNAVPLKDDYGNIIGSIGVFIDIAELQRLRQES
jgi:PAS domain S-box-containing protein